jgi:hypothetical protein
MEVKSPIAPVDLNRAANLTPEVELAVDLLLAHHTWDEEQRMASAEVRCAIAEAVKVMISRVPPCPTRTVAIRKLVEATMDANRAITFRGGF